VVVEVSLVGLCGTDVELFAGTMPYFASGEATYPLVPGHEWSGTVHALGDDVTSVQLGDLVTGDTFLGCGSCRQCDAGRTQACAARYEVGVRHGWPGAAAEQLLMPADALHRLPPTVDAVKGVFVEPGSCAARAIEEAMVSEKTGVAIWGTGTLGLLMLQIARARGAEVDVIGLHEPQLRLAAQLGARQVLHPDEVLDGHYDVVVDATGSPDVPAAAMSAVAAGGKLVLVGVPASSAQLDAVAMVQRDLTVRGLLGGSAHIPRMIDLLANGAVAVEPLVARYLTLEQVADFLSEPRRDPDVAAPKTLVSIRG